MRRARELPRLPRSDGAPVRVLFVCLGDICRSPTAEGVMRELVREEGLEEAFELDSAGTGAWHIGSRPDARARAAARRRGVELGGQARQVGEMDFEHFDLLVAMDGDNAAQLRALAPNAGARAKVRLLREFDPAAGQGEQLDVPDPYYGGPSGFDDVLDAITAACRGLAAAIADDDSEHAAAG